MKKVGIGCIVFISKILLLLQIVGNGGTAQSVMQKELELCRDHSSPPKPTHFEGF